MFSIPTSNSRAASTAGFFPPTSHGCAASAPATTNVGVLSGWDFNTNTSSSTSDGVNHYYFNVTNSAGNAAFTATATLVWNRHQNKTASTISTCFYTTPPTATLSLAAPASWTTLNTFLCRNRAGPLRFAGLENSGGSTVSDQRNLRAGVGIFLYREQRAQSPAQTFQSRGRFIRMVSPFKRPPISLRRGLEHKQSGAGRDEQPKCVLMNATNGSQFYRLWRP
jgi:hypothetical protein